MRGPTEKKRIKSNTTYNTTTYYYCYYCYYKQHTQRRQWHELTLRSTTMTNGRGRGAEFDNINLSEEQTWIKNELSDANDLMFSHALEISTPSFGRGRRKRHRCVRAATLSRLEWFFTHLRNRRKRNNNLLNLKHSKL